MPVLGQSFPTFLTHASFPSHVRMSFSNILDCDLKDARKRCPSRTASTDFCLHRFFWATRFLILIFSLFFVSVPCARLSWPSRQLLSSRKSNVSYRIVITRCCQTVWSSAVCLSACLCVHICWSPPWACESIEMPFGGITSMDQGTMGRDHPTGKGYFGGFWPIDNIESLKTLRHYNA